MGRRASKKNKKVERKRFTPIPIPLPIVRSGTYKISDRFMRKARNNAQVGKLFTPIMEDYPRETEIAITRSTIHRPFNPIDDIRDMSESTEHFNIFENACTLSITGRCAVCDMCLTYKYSDDYPDEWKLCCFCQPNAKKLIEGTLEPTTDNLKKLYDKITLVKGNGKKR